ncbi:heme-binding protein [Halomonas denitrificans]|nr:heme-binding protein [Halomonas denitrificans]
MNRNARSIRPTVTLLALALCATAAADDPVGTSPFSEDAYLERLELLEHRLLRTVPSSPRIALRGPRTLGSVTGPRLLADDSEAVIARAVHQADALGAVATIAVVDRVGNVLAVYRMNGSNPDVLLATTDPGRPAIDGGLEGIVLPATVGGDALAAIAKAVTGAYLSTSDGNAFTTRTANQIVQEHFNPGEFNQPSGPLFGVQFSQLACSDFTLAATGGGASPGPQRSPLGLSADPGGLPLYKDGALVGGVGVMADGDYGIDRNILDFDVDLDERIALAATFGFTPPDDIRADRITVEGKTLRFTDVDFDDLAADPAAAPAFSTLGPGDGSLIPVPGYSDGSVREGTVFGTAPSGIRGAPAATFPDRDAFVFVDGADQDRYPPQAGTDASALSAEEVRVILDEALGVANQARAQIRRPLGSQARVTVSVVDSNGVVLGMARSRDAPVFGADVSLQKARTAAFFSSAAAGAFLEGVTEPTVYLDANLAPRRFVDIPDYVDAVRAFVGASALADGTAFSDRAGGNLSRPFFPDGILGTDAGPLSKPAGEWSVFSTGLQLDLAMNGIVQHIGFVAGLFPAETPDNCVGVELGSGISTAPGGNLANGIQIFPGSVPIYRGDTLVGGIGVSGDGIDQDDMIALLGVERAGQRLGGMVNNAPDAIRADRLTPRGVRLRYVQCPFAPFLDSNVQNACSGI